MRIGMDFTPLVKVKSGVGQYVRHLAENLLALTNDVSLVGFSVSARNMAVAEPLRGIPHHHIPAPTRLAYKLWDVSRGSRLLGSLLSVERFTGQLDVFHATNYYMPNLQKAAKVLTIHDLSFLVVPELCSRKVVGPFSKRIGEFARSSDVVITDSEATRRDVMERFGLPPARVRAISLGVSGEFRPMDKPQCREKIRARYGVSMPFILFVGNVEPRKNVAGLIRAYARLREIAPSLEHRLLLVGDVWARDPVMRLASELKVSEQVTITGYVNESDLPLLYNAADAFVFPSHYEGFGLPPLEAMACGCPVICSNSSSLPEVVGDAAVLVHPTDIEGLAEAMLRVIEDESFARDMARRGIERASRFTWEDCAKQTMEAYRDALRGRS